MILMNPLTLLQSVYQVASSMLHLYCPSINKDTRQDEAQNLQAYLKFRFSSVFEQLLLFPELERNNLSVKDTLSVKPL